MITVLVCCGKQLGKTDKPLLKGSVVDLPGYDVLEVIEIRRKGNPNIAVVTSKFKTAFN